MSATLVAKLNTGRASTGKNRTPLGSGSAVVTFTGTPKVNATLTMVDPANFTVTSRKWQRDIGSGFVDISGATSTTYKVQVGDLSGPGLIRPIITGSINGASQAISSGVPDVPSSVVATPGDTTISVAVGAPANNGGSAVTGYVATDSATGETFASATSPINITGRTNGVSRTISVVAVNTNGSSDPIVSSSVTPVASGQSFKSKAVSGSAVGAVAV